MADGQSDQTVKLRLTTKHRSLLLATGDDIPNDDDNETPEQRGVSASADLSTVDRPLNETEPDARTRRTGFTS